jgi:hypothetical protein
MAFPIVFLIRGIVKLHCKVWARDDVLDETSWTSKPNVIFGVHPHGNGLYRFVTLIIKLARLPGGVSQWCGIDHSVEIPVVLEWCTAAIRFQTFIPEFEDLVHRTRR